MDTYYTWKGGDTWRKIAYLYYGDSRQWRRLLELNPSYSINEHPAEGLRIKVAEPSTTTTAKIKQGSLRQSPTTLDLRSTSSAGTPTDVSDRFNPWPWSTKQKAIDRMTKYTFQSLLKPENANGLSMDDDPLD